VLVFKPIPDCQFYVNFFFFGGCTAPINYIYGIDPDVLLALAFAVLGTVVLIFGSAKFGKASIVTR
jgi:hypothetical protein